MADVMDVLKGNGIQPTPQRLAVAQVVFGNRSHPSADAIWKQVQKICRTASRATVYNTLNLFVEKGLIKTQLLKGGTVVFDSLTGPHHHFIDEDTGKIYDIPWEEATVRIGKGLDDFHIREYQVVMRGNRKDTHRS